jgi:hypothetical protein
MFTFAFFGGLLAAANTAWSAEVAAPAKTNSAADESWAYQPGTPSQPNARAIVQEKAAIRAEQRMDRLAALNWYGVSLSRPASAPIPFTSPRASWWDRPHQLPYAWYEAVQRPFNVHVTTDDRVAQRGYQPVNH